MSTFPHLPLQLVLFDITVEMSVRSEEDLSAHTSVKEKQSVMYGSWLYLRLARIFKSYDPSDYWQMDCIISIVLSRQAVFAGSDFFLAKHNGMLLLWSCRNSYKIWVALGEQHTQHFYASSEQYRGACFRSVVSSMNWTVNEKPNDFHRFVYSN